jgi:flagellar motor switch protein FliN
MKRENEIEMAAPQIIELSELPAPQSLGDSILGANLDAVHSVKARLSVMVGEVTVSIGELLAAKADQVLTLDRLADEPVDILLEGQVVARGVLVAVDDNFGVQITELPRAGQA